MFLPVDTDHPVHGQQGRGHERTKLTGDMLEAPRFTAARVAEGAGYLGLCLEGVLCPALCQSQ